MAADVRTLRDCSRIGQKTVPADEKQGFHPSDTPSSIPQVRIRDTLKLELIHGIKNIFRKSITQMTRQS